jgi:hypothetical protein
MTDWSTVLIISIAPIVSAFGAIWIKGRIDRRTRLEDRQWVAYQKLAAASEIIAMRSAIYNSQRGPRYAAGAALNAVTKFVMVMFLSLLKPLRKDREWLRMLVDSLPTPAEQIPLMEMSEFVGAMDELIRARVEVHLVGGKAAIEAADELLDRSKEFLTAVETEQMSITKGWSSKSPPAELERERMLDAHHRFLTTIRLESKTPTPV